MAIVEVITKLSTAEISAKEEHYLNLVKLFSENTEAVFDGLNIDHIKDLCNIVVDDLKKETTELPHLAKLMQLLFNCKNLQKFFPQSKKVEIIKSIIDTVDSSQHENILVNCFSVIILISPLPVENSVLNDLLQRMEEILSKKNDVASTYSICCFFQKVLKDYEERLSNFIPVLSKLVFLPLCHPSTKVREVAEKTLDAFPKLLLYTSDEEASNYLIKLVKESFSKNLLLLFKEKQELYALKVWTHVINALGSALYKNLTGIMPFFTVLERGFKSSVDDICIASFVAWKSLINSFAASDGVLNDSKILRFTLKPFKNVSRLNENVVSVVCDTWWHLAWNLAGNLSNRFSEVCIPLLELTIGKITNGHHEKTFPKGGLISKDIKKCCYILLRFLEQPPSESFNRLSSPKKLPNIPYPALQVFLDIKVITHHFKEILHAFKIIIDVCGAKDEMKFHLDTLMKSVLFIVSTAIEDSNKESVEAVINYLNFLCDIIEAKSYPSLLCLKSLESLSKLSRKILVSHCFSCGSRKSQDILCTSLLKLLLTPHLFPSEAPKRFFAAYNRLVQAGIHESFHALSVTHKFMHIIRHAVGGNSFDVEVLIDIWSGVATPLLEVIEKTQEVNQGDKQEHDFSCMYDVLLFPFEFIFPVYIHQFRTRPTFKLWTSLYKAFICSASLVTTTSSNEACEVFCCKLKEYLKEDIFKKPHFFEILCLFMQFIIDSIDFSFGNASGTIEAALMIKRKKPLGNLSSFVNLLAIILTVYHDHYIEEETSIQSSAPIVQRKLHIVRSAAPLDILKTFFGNLKSGSLISYILEQLVPPISKLFLKSSQKMTSGNYVHSKLELVWNVLSSSIERYYLGPYDSEFLALMSPLLEATFSHPKRNFKEKTRRFWFATFGPNASSLSFPDSLKTVLKKMKLPLLPDDISPTEFSISPMPDSATEDSMIIDLPVTAKPTFIKPQSLKTTPSSVNGETSKVITKDHKQSPKISIDDLPSEEFVKIDSPVITTTQRRGIRKRKSFVPTLYNDLSQDTATLMSSSESQDTMNSAPLEEIEMKEPVEENKKFFQEVIEESVLASQKDTLNVSEDNIKSPVIENFEKQLNKDLKNEQVQIQSQEIITRDSSENSNTPDNDKNNVQQVTKDVDDTKLNSIEPNVKVPEKEENNVQLVTKDVDDTKLNSLEPNVKVSKKGAVSSKISVFSKRGKLTGSRNTRRFTRLSQSFSFAFVPKESETLENQKLNKTCDEIIHLSDSDEIIPSSQSSSENENSSKLSVSKNKSLSAEDKSKKSVIIDSCSKDIGSSPLINSLPVRKVAENINTNALVDEDMDIKIISSTPMKSKIVKENLTVTTSKNITISHNVETLDQEGKNDKSNSTNELEIHTDLKLDNNDKDDVKDLNFLLDAVDDLIKTSSKESCHLSDNKKSPEFPEDVEMECMAVSEAKDALSNPPDEKSDTEVVKEQPVKKSRLNSKLTDKESSQTGVYSQKLRKKSIKAEEKPKPNLKRKTLLKVTSSGSKEDAKNDVNDIEDNLNLSDENKQLKITNPSKQESNVNNKKNNIKNYKNDAGPLNENIPLEGIKPGRKTVNSNKSSMISIPFKKENVLIENDSPSVETTNFRKNVKNDAKNKNLSNEKESHSVDIKDSSKKSNLDQNSNKQGDKVENSELSNLEAEHVEENSPELAAKLSLDVSNRLDDNVKISTTSNDQTEDSSGSCEIFDTLSEKHSEDLNKDICSDIVPSDSNDLLDSDSIKKTKSDCNADDLEDNNSSHVLDKICPISSSTTTQIKDSEENIEQNILTIPSSLNDDNLDTETKTKEGDKTSFIKRDTAIICTVKPSPTVKSNVEIENKIIESSPISIHFSDTEDDISCEVHNIVNAIVDESCENNINEPENKSASFVDKNSVKSVQFPGVDIDKEKESVDKELHLSHNELIENIKSSDLSKEKLSEGLEEDSNSNLGTLFNSDSSDVIMSSIPESELEDSDKIIQNSIENSSNLSVEKRDKNIKSLENIIYLKPAAKELTEKSEAEKQSKKFLPELDHSYSVPENLSNKLVGSHESTEKIECPNSEFQFKKEAIVVRCGETQDNLSLSIKKKVITELNSNVSQSDINISNLNKSGRSKNVESSDNMPFSLSSKNIPANDMFDKRPIQLSNEDEIKHIVQELIVQVEELDSSLFTNPNNNNTSFSFEAAMENFVQNNSESFADKENHLLASSDDSLAKGSKKRKIKPPIRSPFNLRVRGKMENPKKLCTKNIKSLSISQIKSGTENKDLILKSLFTKTDGKGDENVECSMAKIISSIVDAITDDDNDIANTESLPDEPSSSQITKAQRIELSNDELTDLNTRLNASLAPQTRRSKMIAASNKITNETETDHSNVVIVCSGESTSNLSSILKKRKSTTSLPAAKVRKVTFASPLIHEVVIESCSESRGIETVTMNRLQNLTRKRKKILQEKNKTEKGPAVLLPITIEPEDVPSSSEYQDSDVMDFNDLPVSPALINCPDDVSNILKDLTSPSWVRGLESLLVSKNIKTIGDVCKLNIHQVKALPFKSPKVSTLHKALMAYINVTQDAALEKFKTIDDGSFVTDSAAASLSVPEGSVVEKSEISDDDKSKLLEETIKDIIQKDQLKELPMTLLGQLIEACGRVITEKSEQKF